MIRSDVRPDLVSRLMRLARQGRPAVQAASVLVRSPQVGVAAQVAMLALCLVPIGLQAAQDWDGIRSLAVQLQAPAVLASLLVLVLASFFLPMAMPAYTGGAAHRIGYRHSALAYYASQPMKYLPGSFWILPGRMILLRKLGHDLSLSSVALLFEMTAQVLTSSLVAVALVGAAGFGSIWYQDAAWLILAGSLAASVLLVISPALAGRLGLCPAGLREAMIRLAAVPLSVRLRNLLLTTLSYTAMWLLMELSFYALVVAVDPRLDLALLQAAVGVFTISWLAGFLTPFSPGGVGIREAVLVLLLAPLLGRPEAVMLALFSRVLALGVELAFAAAAWLSLRAAS